MTTIKAVFEGKPEDLQTALVFSIHQTSTSKIMGHRLYASWICETSDYNQALENCMDSVRMDNLGPVSVLRIG
tara:strand:- start:49475 stop:49693 length:219 start_codon:yes stop_codon:yes gene_type:complete